MRTVHHRKSGWSFWICPTLDRGWGYDPYVQRLIGRIRAGRHTTELFDNNVLFLNQLNPGGHDLQRVGLKLPKPTKAQMEEYEASLTEIKRKQLEQDERERAERRERHAALVRQGKAAEAERQREYAEWRRRERERIAEHKRRQQEWQEADPASDKPPAPAWDLVAPTSELLGRQRKQGDMVSVAVLLLGNDDQNVLVNAGGGRAVWVAKSEILEVRTNSSEVRGGGLILHELTVRPEIAAGLRD